MKVLVLSAMSREQTATGTLARLAVEACTASGASVELVTPADLNLPVNDGSIPWDREDLVRWRQRVSESDAQIWVSPEYHGAVAASLKNMFDYLERAPLDGDVVGLCALAAGAVAALNTLNGMAVIARSLGAWVVPNMCAFGAAELREGLDDRGLGRLKAMCDTVIDTATRLGSPATAGGTAAPAEETAAPIVVHDAAARSAEPEPVADAPLSVIRALSLSDVRDAGRGVAGRRVHALRQGRPVMVRVITSSVLAGPERQEFEDEQARVRALPDHPNLVVPREAGVTPDGSAYTVSERCDSLSVRLRDGGPIAWRDAVDAGVRLAGALETVHRAGLLHRDLGPLNVVFRADGKVALADTAVARPGVTSVEGQPQVALAHLAPEIFKGAPPAEAADLYSLGATLFAMLVGRAAFTDDADRKVLGLIRRVMGEPVPDLRTQVPEPVCRVIERCMAKAADERFSGAEELGRALQQAQMMSQLPTATMTLFGGAEAPSQLAMDAVSVFGQAGGDIGETTSGGSEIS